MMFRTVALALATAVLLVPMQAPAQAGGEKYTPRRGATFNSPLAGPAERRDIFDKVLRTVESAKKGSEIYIYSWNVYSREVVDHLLRAQREGVRVQVIMSKQNLKRIDNTPFERLRRDLRRWNRAHPRKRNSWARVCGRSCRGRSGAAHSKFFLFSDLGKAEKVVMQGSANLTVASATNQWNDLYTHRGTQQAWRFTRRIFRQAAKDKPVRSPYATERFGRSKLLMFPMGRKDPVMSLLNDIRCTGATNTKSGRTVVRITPDVLRQDRGNALATKIAALHRGGCDVKVGYTVMGIEAGRILRASNVPMKHLVQDFDCDGDFDNYFHLKAMTVRGHVDGDRSGFVTLNGSANWTDSAARSDENLGIYRKKGITKKYQEHLDYWYDNFPTPGTCSAYRTSARGVTLEPEDRLIFGVGTNAVYANGQPVSDDPSFNPFVNRPRD